MQDILTINRKTDTKREFSEMPVSLASSNMKGEDVKRRHLFDSSHFIPAINHVYLGNSGAMTGERFFHPQKKKFRSMEVHI